MVSRRRIFVKESWAEREPLANFIRMGLATIVIGGAACTSGMLRNLYLLAAMARWPRQTWTTLFTYLTVFLLFPVLCLLAYAWVRGW